MAETDLETFGHLIEAANAGDVDRVLEGMAEDVEWIPGRSAVQGTYRGHDGVRAFFADSQENFDVFRVTPEEVRDLGGQLLVFGTVRVRGKGSGVEVDVSMAGVVAFVHGKVVRWEDFRERDRALEAVGLSK